MIIDVKDTIEKFKLRPIKSLGQNFLTDYGVLISIVRAAEIGKNDLVLEIGSGTGNLTAELAENAGMVVAVEIDRRLIPALETNLKAYANVRILNADILAINLEKELQRYISQSEENTWNIKIVANLPYYITTPVITKLLESGIKAKTMVFMVQKEVAERMMAKPGGKDYGALSIAVQYHSRVSVVAKVPPHCFIPQPEVDSVVVKLELYDRPPVELHDEELFFRIVRSAFGQRRKTLLNALNNSGCIGRGKDKIREMIAATGIDENQRGETLSIEQFARLSNIVFEAGKNNNPGD